VEEMAVKVNRRVFEHAKQPIAEGRVVLDERDHWSEHRPTAAQEMLDQLRVRQ
jgi:hypothetical protein